LSGGGVETLRESAHSRLSTSVGVILSHQANQNSRMLQSKSLSEDEKEHSDKDPPAATNAVHDEVNHKEDGNNVENKRVDKVSHEEAQILSRSSGNSNECTNASN